MLDPILLRYSRSISNEIRFAVMNRCASGRRDHGYSGFQKKLATRLLLELPPNLVGAQHETHIFATFADCLPRYAALAVT